MTRWRPSWWPTRCGGCARTPNLGVAGALRDAQLAMLADAGKGLPAEIAHPFFWAPFAVIGEGGERLGGTTAENRVSPRPVAGL